MIDNAGKLNGSRRQKFAQHLLQNHDKSLHNTRLAPPTFSANNLTLSVRTLRKLMAAVV
ncbi:hypothetical protein [Bradyrhizobium archetypum]|uniref:Uncharacterized protein n=1 Tax=Bradyrhizobium archetypum TaxID=2721160 RepID=A0A7Y4M225_9BRAD|nr:hypothetical protein [Bradyrhizobium archetypum]NOJ46996.1 hypothetical protein [Bradyrhizobium archetypum]